ncbi:MAG TPA: RNB domain-containing ribonuclease [Candidatus Acidoferrum sp.]|nr:RNB domain-containing ribonuclease [Candidatus Acidoferrum sp.]
MEISQGLYLPKNERKHLFKMLSKLKKRNLIVEVAPGRYQLKSKKAAQAEAKSDRPDAQAPRTGLGGKGISGRLVLHQDGYGFVIPDEPIPNIEGDIFVPRHATEDAMHGDRVAVEVRRTGFSSEGQRIEGRIVRVLNRAHPSVVGLFRYGPHGNVVLPYDTRIHHQVEIPPGQELTAALRKKLGFATAEEATARARRLPRLAELDGAVVNAELVRYPRGGLAPVGRVVEILGNPGDLGVDTEIVIRKHHLPHEFSPEALREAEERAQPVSDADRAGREDFRSLPIVTIDGETARDFDDAVYVEKRADGGWHLQVHIADVANYVRTLTTLDNEARLRGTSVYFLHRAVPMLPEELSNGICSLNPHEDRLVMSALMDFDAAGRMTGSRMVSGVIRSAERMTYTNVNKVIEGDAEMKARYAALAPHFQNMKELALLLNARRNEKGSIDFDLPEPVIEFDAEQKMTNITRSERNIAHRLIEEFMLAANRAVAGYLLKRGIAALHRVHEKPDAKKVLEFEELARAFGYSLGVENLHQREIAVRHGRVPAPAKRGRPDSAGRGRERGMKVALPGAGELSITPQHYQRLLKKLVGKTEERIVSYLMLRSLKQARYAPDSLGHFALGFDEYAHFTSPIRRYPDLVVHRALKWALANPAASPPPDPLTAKGIPAALYSHRVLEELATETSDAERRAATAERELRDWKTSQFMEQHLGDEYEGLIISVQKYGCFVELMEVFVEGLLPIGAIEEAAGTRCLFREHEHAIVADRGHEQRRGRGAAPKSKESSWKLGDRVRVRAERIDPMRHRVEFALLT